MDGDRVDDDGGDINLKVTRNHMSNEKKTWLVGIYRGLYYPVK